MRMPTVLHYLLPLVTALTVVLGNHDDGVVRMSQQRGAATEDGRLAPDWFLSASGNNTVDCGHSSRTSCETLDWLLARFHTTSYRTNRTLVLFTDTAVVVNRKIVDQFPWLRQLKVVTSVINATTTTWPVQVTFYDVTVLNTTWLIRGLNLLVANSDLSKAKLTLEGENCTDAATGGSTGTDRVGVVSIHNSTWGKLKVTENYKVKVRKCDVDGASRTGLAEGPLVEINDSTLHIEESSFSGNDGGFHAAVLKASGSQISVATTRFTGNVGHMGVLHIGNGSDLSVTDSAFHGNGHWFFALTTILVDPGSSATVRNSTFHGNIAAYGAGICSMLNSSIIVENCTFMNNSGQLGSSVNCNDEVNWDLVSSDLEVDGGLEFPGMKMPKMGPMKTKRSTTSTKLAKSTKCIVSTTVFNFNEAYSNGGAIYVQGRSAEVKDSKFGYNIGGGTGGGVSSFLGSKVNISNCAFWNNQAMYGSAVSAKESASMSINGSHFYWDPTKYVTGYAIHTANESILTIANSNISNGRWMPGVIDLYNFTQATVVNSTLNPISNRALHAVNNVNIKFTGCSFHTRCRIQVYDNVFVTIENGSFTDCPAFYGNMIELHFGSHLLMSGTTIANITTGPTGRALIINSGCTATLLNCTYINNYIWQHIIMAGGTLRIHDVLFRNNTGNWFKFGGIMVKAVQSEISITNSRIQNNLEPAWLELDDSSFFLIVDSNLNISGCTIEDNHPDFLIYGDTQSATARTKYIQITNSTINNYGASIHLSKVDDINIEDSTLVFHRESYGELMMIQSAHTVRISNCLFRSSIRNPELIYFIQQSTLKQSMKLETLNSSFSRGNQTIRSDTPDFMKKMISSKMFQVDFSVQVNSSETPYASSTPVRCHSSTRYPCYCHYFMEQRANIYNCSNSPVTEVPPVLPVESDWLIMENNQISKLIGSFQFLKSIWFLNLAGNQIRTLSVPYIQELDLGRRVKLLNLAHNKISNIPSEIQYVSFLEKVWLSGNPFHCDCSMTWMIGWLNNFTTPTGQHVIQDYKDVICHSGLMIGKPIYLLKEVEMGCYPSKWTLQQKIGVAIGSSLAMIVIITLSILVVRKYRDIKFFLYYYCKWCTCCGVPRDDKNENLTNIQYDAYLMYSNKDTKWVSQVLRRNKWQEGSRLFDLEKDHGFRLMVPQRDVLVGRESSQQVDQGMERSRKIIFIISRHFMRSNKLWLFKSADAEALKKRKIIIIFKEKLKLEELIPELKTYKKLRLGIEPDANIDKLAARIRYNMPARPLTEIRPQDFPKIGDEENEFDDWDEETDTEYQDDQAALPLNNPVNNGPTITCTQGITPDPNHATDPALNQNPTNHATGPALNQNPTNNATGPALNQNPANHAVGPAHYQNPANLGSVNATYIPTDGPFDDPGNATLNPIHNTHVDYAPDPVHHQHILATNDTPNLTRAPAHVPVDTHDPAIACGPSKNLDPNDTRDPTNNIDPTNNLDLTNNRDPARTHDPDNKLDPTNTRDPARSHDPANNLDPDQTTEDDPLLPDKAVVDIHP